MDSAIATKGSVEFRTVRSHLGICYPSRVVELPVPVSCETINIESILQLSISTKKNPRLLRKYPGAGASNLWIRTSTTQGTGKKWSAQKYRVPRNPEGNEES